MSLVEVSVLQQNDQYYELSTYDVISIRSRSIVCYKEYFHGKAGRKVQENSLQNLEKKGKVSHLKTQTVKRIEKMLTAWMKALLHEKDQRSRIGLKADRMPVFVTLTLPAQQIHPDQAIKRDVLMPFIQELKRKHGLEHYFWRAELQKNYNLHFHLIGDCFLDRHLIQHIWNKHLNTLGYVDRFEKKHAHRNPPSTHVERITSVEKMISYVVKYVCKESDELPADGRKWDASKKLKEFKPVVYPVDSEISDWMSDMVMSGKVEVWENEHCCIFSFTKQFDFKRDYAVIARVESSDLAKMYRYLYHGEPDVPVVDNVVKSGPKEKPRQLSLFEDRNLNWD